MDHVLERQLVMPIRQKDAWDFFSDPRNLARITPQAMRLEITNSPIDGPIFTGMQIAYRIRPLLGIPLNWLTEICDVAAPHRFTDVQVRGPFARWEHEHTFIGTPHGMLMHDRVNYRLPLGRLGRSVHAVLVRRWLEEIFDHRELVLRAIFAGS